MKYVTVRPAAATAVLFALFGLSRYLDGFIRLFLRQKTGETFFSALARNFRVTEVGQEVLTYVGLGLVAWFAYSLLLAWLGKKPPHTTLNAASRAVIPLTLPIGLTAVSCMSLIWSPRFPYGANLVLTSACEGPFASILVWTLLGASVIHTLWRHVQRPIPLFDISGLPAALLGKGGKIALVFGATASFAVLTPTEFWDDGFGQGHMLRYLRMTATLAGSGTLDIAQADVARATPSGFLSLLPQMGVNCLQEAHKLLRAVLDAALEGKLYTGSIRAVRANRAMFRHPEGGIYYIMNPGPGLVLLPAYLVDRVLNRWLGTELQVAVVLFWNLLGALLILQMMEAAREITRSPVAAALAATLALGFAPPLIFYTYQVYPELLGALLLIYSFRRLLADPAPRERSVVTAALAVAFLPWLHQKYFLTATLVGLLAAFRLIRRGPPRLIRVSALLAPLALSALAILIYNHALTGSILPDATYRAAGRGTFSLSNTLRGSLGLLFDVENGILVYAPIYLLAFAGFRRFAARHRTVWLTFLAVAVSFIAVVGSVPYWSGPVSSVARFMVFVAPLSVLPVALALGRCSKDGAVAGVAVTTFAATSSFTLSFMNDRIPTYHTDLLLDRVLFSDPYQYLPSFHSEGLIGSGPAHLVKLAAVIIAVVAIVTWLGRRISSDQPGDGDLFPRKATLSAASLLGIVFIASTVLEVLPGNRTEKAGPVYRDSRPLQPRGSGQLVVDGKHGFEGPGVWVPGGGSTRFLILSPAPMERIRMNLRNGTNENRVQLQLGGARPRQMSFSPRERKVITVPLNEDITFEGPEGKEWIYEITVKSRSGFVPRDDGKSEDSRRLGCYVVFRDI